MTGVKEISQNQNALAVAMRQINRAVNEAYGHREHLAPILATVAIDLVKDLKQELSHPGTGATYGNHTASAPGEPPAVDVGRLRASVDWQPGEDALGPYVEVGTNVDYGPMLEFGTSKMAARPWFRTVIDRATTRIAGIIAEGLRRRMREAAHRV